MENPFSVVVSYSKSYEKLRFCDMCLSYANSSITSRNQAGVIGKSDFGDYYVKISLYHFNCNGSYGDLNVKYSFS